MENLWLYLRKSRDEDSDPLILSKHRSELLRLAESDGIAVREDQVFAEIGSADEIESRPVFRGLLATWERLPRNAGGVVYSTEVSRLTRGLQSQQGRVQDALARANLRHRTRQRWYDLRVPDDCTAWELEGFIARMEHRHFKARVMAAWEEMLRAGRVRGGMHAFGYRWSRDEQNLLPVPGDFDVLSRCCREVSSLSVKQLARKYSVPETALLRALANPLICGYPARRYGPQDPEHPRRSHYRLLAREEWTWPEQQNTDYPHACTREEWEAIQQVIASRRQQHSLGGYEDGWCRNVVRFPQSPGPCRLSVCSFRRKDGKSGRYLTYERRPEGGRQLYIAREVVHETVLPDLTHLFADRNWVRALEQAETERGRSVRSVRSDDKEALQRSLALTRRRYQEAVDAEMDAADMNFRLALAQRRRRLERELERLQAETREQPQAAPPDYRFRLILAELPELPRHFATVWDALNGEERRRLVECVFAEVQVTVTPRPGAHERRVTGVLYHPWVEP